jgi:hypothetical protein
LLWEGGAVAIFCLVTSPPRAESCNLFWERTHTQTHNFSVCNHKHKKSFGNAPISHRHFQFKSVSTIQPASQHTWAEDGYQVCVATQTANKQKIHDRALKLQQEINCHSHFWEVSDSLITPTLTLSLGVVVSESQKITPTLTLNTPTLGLWDWYSFNVEYTYRIFS